jgi:hypothetical protein
MIIDNSREARSEHSLRFCGLLDYRIDKDELAALLAGKCIASDNGEYALHIRLKGSEDEESMSCPFSATEPCTVDCVSHDFCPHVVGVRGPDTKVEK